MGFLFKTLAAFCIGAAALVGAQNLWFRSVVGHVTSANFKSGLPEMKAIVPTMNVKSGDLFEALHPKLDPNIGRDAAGAHINSQVNQAIRAGQNIPPPPSIPGLRG